MARLLLRRRSAGRSGVELARSISLIVRVWVFLSCITCESSRDGHAIKGKLGVSVKLCDANHDFPHAEGDRRGIGVLKVEI
jgi:hypothetical protein